MDTSADKTCTLTVHKVTSCSDKIHSPQLLFKKDTDVRKPPAIVQHKAIQQGTNLTVSNRPGVLTVLNATPHSSTEQHTLLQRNAWSVVYIGSPHPCQLTCALQAADEWVWSADFLPPSLPPSLLPPSTTIHLFLIVLFNFSCTSYFRFKFRASIFCSQQKFDYLCLRIY